MVPPKWFIPATAIVTSSALAAPILDTQMYVVDSASQLLKVDVTTGEAEWVGSTSVPFTDIAIRPDGVLFGVTSSYLYQVDPQNGWSKLIGRHGFGGPGVFAGIDSLVSDHQGKLFAAGDDILITIDPQSGVGTRIGSLSGYHSAGDLTVDRAGRMLLTTDEGLLIKVEARGLGAEPIGMIPYHDVYSLVTLPTGEVYGIRSNNRLVALDPSTGRAAETLPLWGDFLMGRAWGAAIPVYHTPEPATWALLALSASALYLRRVRRA